MDYKNIKSYIPKLAFYGSGLFLSGIIKFLIIF